MGSSSGSQQQRNPASQSPMPNQFPPQSATQQQPPPSSHWQSHGKFSYVLLINIKMQKKKKSFVTINLLFLV
jgi:hypothetical protein